VISNQFFQINSYATGNELIFLIRVLETYLVLWYSQSWLSRVFQSLYSKVLDIVLFPWGSDTVFWLRANNKGFEGSTRLKQTNRKYV
jgi:hypothetical protein